MSVSSQGMTGFHAQRAIVVRQASQTAINRCVPAINQSEEPVPLSSRYVRSKPRIAATNEFAGRARSGPCRQPAQTKVVNVGNMALTASERRHVRGVTGFFPSSIRRSGDGRRAGSVTPSAADQDAEETYQDNITTESPRNQAQENETQNRALSQRSARFASSARKSDSQRSKEYHDFLRRKALECESGVSLNGTESTAEEKTTKSSSQRVYHGAVKQRDGAWVKAFKVKQKRNSRLRDMLESKSTPNLKDSTTW